MRFEGLEETFEEEIAVDIMEDNGDSVQLIRQIMDFLIQYELMVEQEDQRYFFPQAAEMSGDEGASAERMRNMRARNKETGPSNNSEQSDDQPSQSDNAPLYSDEAPSQNDDESQCDNEPSQCDDKVSQRYQIQNQNQNNRIDRSRAKSRIDLDLDVDLKQEAETGETDSASVSAEHRAASAAANAAAPPAAELFSVEQIREIVRKHEVDLNGCGVMAFHTEMQSSGWVLYSKPITKAGIVKALRGWAKYHEGYHSGDDFKKELKIFKVIGKYLGEDKRTEFINNDDSDCELLNLCPVTAFDNEMIEYMEEEWGICFEDGVFFNEQ